MYIGQVLSERQSNDNFATDPPLDSDNQLVEALREGDERAFAQLLDKYHGSMIRVATLYCRDEQVAEDATQETWLAILNGIHQFEGRSTLKTWIFSILSNKAKTRGQRERRSVPFSQLVDLETDQNDPALPEEFFNSADSDADWIGWWHKDNHPTAWQNIPETTAFISEMRTKLETAMMTLPHMQGQVIYFRDVLGYESQEICNILNLSETNQRVLLHRARSKVRLALEQYFNEV